jgi:hypothetical protein
MQIVEALSILTPPNTTLHKELLQLLFLKNGAIAWINAMGAQVVRAFCKE